MGINLGPADGASNYGESGVGNMLPDILDLATQGGFQMERLPLSVFVREGLDIQRSASHGDIGSHRI